MKADAVVIKKISRDDKEVWSFLWKNYLKFYNTERSQIVFNTTFDRLSDENYINCEGFIAYLDKKAIGIVHCLYHIHLWQQEKICYLQDLFVEEGFRNLGVGRRLIEQVYASADSKRAKGVYWLTQDFNTTAQNLYDKIGVKTPFIKYTRT